MRDKSKREIIDVVFGPDENIFYLHKGFSEDDEEQLDEEKELNRKAIVVKFANPVPETQRPKAKVYYIDDYRKEKQ